MEWKGRRQSKNVSQRSGTTDAYANSFAGRTARRKGVEKFLNSKAEGEGATAVKRRADKMQAESRTRQKGLKKGRMNAAVRDIVKRYDGERPKTVGKTSRKGT